MPSSPVQLPGGTRTPADAIAEIAAAVLENEPIYWQVDDELAELNPDGDVRSISIPRWVRRARSLIHAETPSGAIVKSLIPGALIEAAYEVAVRTARELKLVVRHPYLGFDPLTESWDIVSAAEHYEPQTATLLKSSVGELPEISFDESKELLNALLKHWEWRSKSDATHALGMLLTPFIYPGLQASSIDGCVPMHFIAGDQKECGKTSWVQATQIIVEGLKRLPASVGNASGPEFTYALPTILQRKAEVCNVDNQTVGDTIVSDQLAGMLSSGGGISRRVRTSEEIISRLPPLFCMTGIAPRFGEEIGRRTIVINLTRTGKHEPRELDELLDAVLKDRPRYVAACIVLVRFWLAAGRPRPSRTLSDYTRWSDIVGGILASLGLDDGWMMPEHRPAGVEDEDLLTLIRGWKTDDVEGSTVFVWATFAEIKDLAKKHSLGMTEKQLTARLQYLVKHERAVGGYRIKAKTLKGYKQYKPVKP